MDINTEVLISLLVIFSGQKILDRTNSQIYITSTSSGIELVV